MSIRESPEPQDNVEKQLRLIAEIRRIANMLGVDRLSQREFDRLHQLGGTSTIGYQFGSWNRALIAAGLNPNPQGGGERMPELSAADLLDEILRLRDELKKLPSERELSRFGRFSLSPYKDRWGTFKHAKEAALAYEQQHTKQDDP
jgi:hypothetical protein